MSKRLVDIVPAALVIILFLILYFYYDAAAYPQGDDAIHLFAWAKHALPEPGGHIANRIVDAFFNRFLFLVFRPVDYAISGGTFFHSFARYTALLNATIACWLTALTAYLSYSRLKCNTATRSSIMACSLALTLQVVFGDTTHTIAYNLTLAICLSFITAVMPVHNIFADLSLGNQPDLGSNAFYVLVVLGYFTAFGMELFTVFAWIYFLAGLASHRLCLNACNPAQYKINFIGLLKPSEAISRYRQLYIYYAIFSLVALIFLLGSGRGSGIHTNSLMNLSQLMEYSLGFMRGFRRNPIFSLWLLSVAVIFANCIISFFRGRFLNASALNRQINISWAPFFRPLCFILIVNITYFAILLIAGFKDSRVFVATLEAPNFYTGRSILFLSPLLYVNLIVALRGVAISSNIVKPLVPPFILFSVLLLFSSSYSFLSNIRARSMLKSHVSAAFEMAAASQSDAIEVPFCIPDLVNKDGGYPVLPSAEAAEWYRASYRWIFEQYYGRIFSQSGPVFRLDEKAGSGCGK